MHRDMGPEIAMTRARLFPLRLAVTVFFLLLIYVLLRLLWFPGGYFDLFGVSKLFWILAGFAVIAGPGLSTFLFRPGKKGLKSDLVIIAAIELAIYAWAVAELYARQPAYAVFAVDRFEAVQRKEVDLEKLEFQQLADRPGHAPRLVYAELPTDPDVMSRLIDETVFMGMADIDRRPEFWKPYAQGVSTLRAAAKPLVNLLSGDDYRADVLGRWLRDQPLPPSQYSYLPIRGSRADGTIVLHADIAYPVAVLAIDSW